MVFGVPHDVAVQRRELPPIIQVQRHFRRILGQRTHMDVLEDIKNGESFGQIFGGLLGLLCHCIVFGCRVDPGDAGCVVIMVPGSMSGFQ